MIFEPMVGLQIVEGKIERRDVEATESWIEPLPPIATYAVSRT
jgi:hypothetical protein